MEKTFAALVEYDGSKFKGWQIQKNAVSVQEKVEHAISVVADEFIRVYCAGRTDSGVHSTGQVIHFKTDKLRSDYSWLRGINSNLPQSISILWIKMVDNAFHARFSALARQYRYIFNIRNVNPAILNNYVTWELRKLDVDRMRRASKSLIGEHDFNAYRSIACQSKTPIRIVDELSLVQKGEFIYFDIRANGFLHHMVRNIAGVIASIGSNEKPIDWARELLESKDRANGGVTAPPNGLYLVRVTYPERFKITKKTTMPSYW